MKAGTLFVALIVAGACVGGIVWLAGGSGPSVANSKEMADAHALKISKTGPYPKAVLPQTKYEFDVMGTGTEQSHKFLIKNEGEAPLEYKLKGTNCSCTVSDMEEGKVYTIPEGEQTEIEVKWTPTAPEPEFVKDAYIYTNDPENPTVTFTVSGRVENMITVAPENGWMLENLERNRAEKLTAELHSAVVDEFTISSVEASSDAIQTNLEPLSQSEVEARGSKSGYLLTVTFEPKNLKIGKISETITVHTDIKGSERISLELAGRFLGSISGLPYLPEGQSADGRKWAPEALYLDLGQYRASEGRQGWYKLAVGDIPEGVELEVSEIESSNDYVTASVQPLPAPPNSTRQFRLVTFEVKPGIAPGSYHQNKSVKVVLKTNHPYAPEIKFQVALQAL
jgi:hypothetical protein